MLRAVNHTAVQRRGYRAHSDRATAALDLSPARGAAAAAGGVPAHASCSRGAMALHLSLIGIAFATTVFVRATYGSVRDAAKSRGPPVARPPQPMTYPLA